MYIDSRYRDWKLNNTKLKNLLEIERNLNNLEYEDKIDYLSGLLCNEWYTFQDQKYISQLLNIFSESLND